MEHNIVNISYLTNTHSMSAGTTIGLVLVNYLIHKRLGPSANVVYQLDNGMFKSMYEHSLVEPIGIIGENVVVSHTNFLEDDDKVVAWSSLVEFLGLVQNKSYEDEQLMLTTKTYLVDLERKLLKNQTKRVVKQVPSPKRTEMTSIRESVNIEAPISRSAYATGVKSRSVGRTTEYISPPKSGRSLTTYPRSVAEVYVTEDEGELYEY